MELQLKNRRSSLTHDNQGDCYYDLDFDEDAIAASIAKTYNILPSEQDDLSIPDFIILLQGIGEDTPLANLIKIRREKDVKKIKNMSAYEKEVRQKWADFKAKKSYSDDKKVNKEELIRANEERIKAALMSYAIIKHK